MGMCGVHGWSESNATPPANTKLLWKHSGGVTESLNKTFDSCVDLNGIWMMPNCTVVPGVRTRALHWPYVNTVLIPNLTCTYKVDI